MNFLIIGTAINNWMKNKITTLSIAFSNVEKNTFSQAKDPFIENTQHVQRHQQGTLADSLVHGEVTQDVKDLRWRTYKILDATNKTYLTQSNIDSDGDIHYNTVKVEQKAALRRVKLDNFDSYELEMVFINEEIVRSTYDTISGYILEYDTPVSSIDNDNDIVVSHGEISANEYFASNKTEKPINIIRQYLPKFFIENFTKKINIRKIEDKKRLIEFYISKYPDEYNKNSKFLIREIEKIIKKTTNNISFLEIDELSFITNKTIGVNDFLEYSYKILKFDKIIEFDGFYVIKYISEVLVDGNNTLIKYMENDLELKYKNKELKK